MEKYKKANELDKTLRNLVKLANIPLRGVVAGNFASKKPNKTAKVLSCQSKTMSLKNKKSSEF
jgi:hypothetical protein